MDKEIYAVTYSDWGDYEILGNLLFENKEEAEAYLSSLPKRSYSYDIDTFTFKGKNASNNQSS